MDHLPEALYRAANTRAADRRAVSEFGLADGVLMERAGSAAFALLRERFPRARRIGVVCGPGNNGGDGYVLARLAGEAGLAVTALSLANTVEPKGDALAARDAWRKTGGTVQILSAEQLQACDVIVDALFGTGLERPLEGEWRAAVEAMNASGRPIFAIDIPSGLHADTGRVLGAAVRAALTLSFIGLKAGLFTGQGREHSGLILFNDLGVPDAVFAGVTPLARRITGRNLQGLLAPRRRHAHKGDAGRVLIAGGQPGMPGAVRLAGEAAYRAGAGLVVLATHPAHAALIGAARPELIAHGVNDATAMQSLLAGAQALAIGPGLGQGEWARALWQALLAANVPVVVDADALNLLAAQPCARADWVLTPHPGEAARLLGVSVADIQTDRFAAVRAIVQRYGGVCVLKGSGTLIATAMDGGRFGLLPSRGITPSMEGRSAGREAVSSEGGLIHWTTAGAAFPPVKDEPTFWLCDRGNPGMGTGGSGDVLTGVIAALLAQGLKPYDAARLGVWAHASAGDLAVASGERGVLASDLLNPLREAINNIATHAT
jgi:NAD(P)H-hydrate epimerase